jgi:hypothetical protein
MQMIIRYRSGLRVEAVVLAANQDAMRLAVKSRRDTTELRKLDGCWYCEDGSEIEIEAVIPMEGVQVSAFCSAAACVSAAA